MECAPQNKTTRIKVGMCEKGGKHIDYCWGWEKGHGVLHRIRQLELKEASKRREGTS